MSRRGSLKKKLVKLITGVLVVAQVGGFGALSVYAADTGTVTCSVLNVRSGASTSYGILTTLTRGTKVELLSESNGWYEISINGRKGYISAQYVSKTTGNGDSGNSGSSSDLAAGKSGTVNVSVLNVRSGGSTNHAIIGGLVRGTKVSISESAGGWYKVTTPTGLTGYVFAEYITVSATSATPDTTTPDSGTSDGDASDNETAPTSGTGTCNTDALNVRNGANMSAAIYGYIVNGTKVTIKGTSGDWYKVETTIGGRPVNGYVFKTYITLDIPSTDDTPPAEDTPPAGDSGASGDISGSGSTEPDNSGDNNSTTEETLKTGVCNTSGLNVRKGPSTNDAIYGLIGLGTKVTILGKSGDWYQVKTRVYGIEVTGYVHSAYITLSGETDGSGDTPSDNQDSDVEELSRRGFCTVDVLNIRSNHSTSSQIIGTYRKGDVVVITGAWERWYRIEKEYNGQILKGYVNCNFVRQVVRPGGITISGDDSLLETIETNEDVWLKDTGYKIYLYEFPVSDVAFVGPLEANTKVHLTGILKNIGWSRVEYNGKTWYIATNGLLTEDSKVPEAPPSEDGVDVDETVWTTAVVNVRNSPKTTADIITVLRKDASIKRTRIYDNGWSRVVYGDTVAYIHSDYLTTTEPTIPDPTPGGSGITGVTGEDIVEFAKQWVGYPYVYAGNNLETGVDCSGFTQQVYLHFGIPLYRSADDQRANGARVASIEEAVAGDLFFYTKSGLGADHVAIYMGDGNVIHASTEETGIIISPITYRTPFEIVRIIY